MQLWIKAFHIIAMVCWFSGLFYLPRLFVYHAASTDKISQDRFVIMEKKLYYYIMWPSALLTLLLGGMLLGFNTSFYMAAAWMHIKLGLVALLFVYHLYLGKLFRALKTNPQVHSHKFYRCINELPSLFLIVIVILAVVKP